MGKTPTSRAMVRRDLSQALTLVARVQSYLVRSGGLYEERHPNTWKAFCVLVTYAEQLKKGLEGLRGDL